MMSKINNNKMLTLRVPNALKIKLQAVATYNEVSVSKLIRHSLNNLISAK
jgi:antitoxin component of RelBE/YafQ-DinJ toxin-antitoxin module